MGAEGIAFLLGAGAGALGLFAFLEWQKTQPTGSQTYMDVVGSQAKALKAPYHGHMDVI